MASRYISVKEYEEEGKRLTELELTALKGTPEFKVWSQAHEHDQGEKSPKRGGSHDKASALSKAKHYLKAASQHDGTIGAAPSTAMRASWASRFGVSLVDVCVFFALLQLLGGFLSLLMLVINAYFILKHSTTFWKWMFGMYIGDARTGRPSSGLRTCARGLLRSLTLIFEPLRLVLPESWFADGWLGTAVFVRVDLDQVFVVKNKKEAAK